MAGQQSVKERAREGVLRGEVPWRSDPLPAPLVGEALEEAAQRLYRAARSRERRSPTGERPEEYRKRL